GQQSAGSLNDIIPNRSCILKLPGIFQDKKNVVDIPRIIERHEITLHEPIELPKKNICDNARGRKAYRHPSGREIAVLWRSACPIVQSGNQLLGKSPFILIEFQFR